MPGGSEADVQFFADRDHPRVGWGPVRLTPAQSPPLWHVAAMALAIGAAASVGFWITYDGGHVASLWPPNAIAVAVLLLTPSRIWLALLAAAWAGNTAAELAFGDTVSMAASLSALNALEIVAVTYVMRRRLGAQADDLTHAQSLLWFATVAGFVVPGLVAVLAAGLLHAARGTPFWSVAAVWYPANVLGLGIIVPLSLALRRAAPQTLPRGRGVTVLVATLFAASTILVFSQPAYPLLFVPIPFLLLVAVRLGSAGAAGAVALLSVVALVSTLNGNGPLSLIVGGIHTKILLLQLYLLVASSTALGVAAVIAERDRLNRAVQRSADTFRLLAEHASDIISRVGRDGVRFYVSPASHSVLGIPAALLCGSGLFDRIHPDDQDAVRALQQRLLLGLDERGMILFRATHADGRLIWLETMAQVLRDSVMHLPDGYVSVIRDVTERQERATVETARRCELEAANAQLDRLARHLARARDVADEASLAKSRFVASMSHELRTPLNGILGYAQLLRLEGGLSVTQTIRVEAMLSSGRHLLELVNNVLDVSQIEAGRVDVAVAEVDTLEICGICLELVRPAAIEKALSLTLAAATPVPAVLADKGRLRQILVNLLGNAIKFTAAGEVTLLVAPVAAAVDPSPTEAVIAGRGPPGSPGGSPPMIRFEVADTGPGVPAAKRDRLFQMFQRLDAATGPLEGAGLGLAISRRLVELMGGRIDVMDNTPAGSVFWFELPAAEPLPQAAHPTQVVPAARTAQPRLRVLVVDDVAMNRDVAAAFLRSGHHESVCVASGEAAVAAATGEDFDLVLMDVRMPGMDGLEATRRIRAWAGPRGRVPIVALTAHAFLDQVQECRAAGMDAHVVKPFDHATLLETVNRIVAAARAASPQTEPPAVASPPPGDGIPGGIQIATPGATPGAPDPIGRQRIGAGDAALAAFDQATFERTAALLEPSEMLSCLQTLRERGEWLHHALLEPSPEAAASLAEAAHTLAGSAGMFGFARLVSAARTLERALTAAPDSLADAAPPAVVGQLPAILEAMLMELEHHMRPSPPERAPLPAGAAP